MSRNRKRRRKLPAEPATLTIASLSHEGRGVSQVDGKVAFVSGALPGETVTASYVNRRAQFDELKTIGIDSASPDRIDPPCQYAAQCGGCSLQHMQPSAQLQFKEAVLFEQMQHAMGGSLVDVAVLPRIEADHLHYRRKARLAVRHVVKKGGVLVGFREKSSSFITDMNDCKVMVKEVAELILPLRELLSTLQAVNSIPQIEVAVGEVDRESAELQVALVVRHLSNLCDEDSEKLLDFAGSRAIDLYLQPSGVDSIHKVYPGDGVDRLQYFLPEANARLSFHPADFTQINAGINRQIVKRVLEIMAPCPEESILDLFCGLGNFTIPLAKSCHHVVGVEGSAEMVNRGRQNARDNAVDNTEFHQADLSASLAEQPWADRQFAKILLDPPRSGALVLMPWIAASGAKQVVYVSCNPATLARDAAYLVRNGYGLKSAGVMDMFPHTAHVESMAVFESS